MRKNFHNQLKKVLFLLVVTSGIVAMAVSCSSGPELVNEYGHPVGSITVRPSDMLLGESLAISTTLSSIRTFHPEYSQQTFEELVYQLDSDPANYSYYMPGLSVDVTAMARRYSKMAMTFVFAEKTVGMSVNAIKKLARQRYAINSKSGDVAELEARVQAEIAAMKAEDDGKKKKKKKKKDTADSYELSFEPLTQVEIEILTSDKDLLNNLTEEEEKLLTQVRINNSLAGAGITALIGQSAAFVGDIADMIRGFFSSFVNMITMAASGNTLKHMDNSTKVMDAVRPKLDKNLAASRVVIDALYGRDSD